MTIPNEPRFLVIGRVLRPHGVRGELRIQIQTNFPDRFRHLESVYLATNPEDDASAIQYAVERGRLHQEFAILKLADIEDRDTADTLREQFVLVALEDAMPLQADEYYFYQLIGLTMRTEAGDEIGIVSDILETGANDVYVVQSSRYGEVLIPAIESVIQKIDLPNRQIIITPMEGLLPDAS